MHHCQSEKPTCWTDETGGGDPCIFPFEYDGKEHRACIWAGAFSERNSRPWCGTSVYGDSEWGDCREDCLTEGNMSYDFYTPPNTTTTQSVTLRAMLERVAFSVTPHFQT